MIFTDKLIEAINFACEKHKNQKRKVLEYPYISHPLSVLFIVSHYTSDEDTLASCVLHDTVEDTDVTLEDIETKFGKRTRDIVDILTDDYSILDKKLRKQKQLKRFANADHEVLLVKLGDIINNFCDIIIVLENYSKDKYFEVFDNDVRQKIIDSKERLDVIEKAWADNPLLPEARSRFDDYQKSLNKYGLLN